MRTIAGTFRASPKPTLICAAALLVVAFVLLRYGPLVALVAAVAPLGTYLMVQKSWFRALLLVVGGLFVLGSSSDVSVTKVAYTGAVIVTAVISGLRLLQRQPPWARSFRPLVWFGVALILVLAAGVLLGPPTTAAVLIRQSILYLYIPLAAVIGLDAGRDISPAVLRYIVLVVGMVSAFGFMTYWLERRGASSLSIGSFVLYSLLLPALAFSLGLVMLATERGLLRRLPWLIAVVFIPVAMIVSGTRTNLLLLLGFAGVLGLRQRTRVRPLAAIGILVVGALLIATVFPLIASLVISKPGFIQERLQALLLVLTGGGADDGSYAGRADQYVVALNFIDRSPLLGEGLGYRIPVILDTPLLSIVRIGILGGIAVGAFLVACAVLVHRSAVRFGHSRAHTAFWGLAVVFVVSIPLGTPLEDRGFGYALLLVFMLLASELGHPSGVLVRNETLTGAVRTQRSRRVAVAADA